MNEYTIAIVGAASLLAKELKECLTESPFASATFHLFEVESSEGQIEQIGDEVTIVKKITPGCFAGVDFSFFCGPDELTLQYWREASTAGSTVLDLTGALDGEAGVLVRSAWLEGDAVTPDLLTRAVVTATPAALALALVLKQINDVAEVRYAAATVLVPASEFGKGGLDELHQQTVSLLSFQTLPRAVFDAQIAYNLLTSFGENGSANLATVESRIRSHYKTLSAGRLPELRMQAVAAPVFHGHTFSIAVELAQPVPLSTLEDTLGADHLDLILEETDSPSNLAATGQNDILLWLKPDPPVDRLIGETESFWIWAASDNFRLAAQNAVDCALEMRRLRPHRKVQ